MSVQRDPRVAVSEPTLRRLHVAARVPVEIAAEECRSKCIPLARPPKRAAPPLHAYD
jgi:hypothetical protein